MTFNYKGWWCHSRANILYFQSKIFVSIIIYANVQTPSNGVWVLDSKNAFKRGKINALQRGIAFNYA